MRRRKEEATCNPIAIRNRRKAEERATVSPRERRSGKVQARKRDKQNREELKVMFKKVKEKWIMMGKEEDTFNEGIVVTMFTIAPAIKLSCMNSICASEAGGTKQKSSERVILHWLQSYYGE